MAINNLSQNVVQAINDFASIKTAIINKGQTIPSGTPTSEYASKINAIQAQKQEEEITVELNMASGNQVIIPSTNKVATKVTIIKPENYIPSNIKNGENLGGILGAMVGGLDADNLELLMQTASYHNVSEEGVYLFFGTVNYEGYDNVGTRITTGNSSATQLLIFDLINHTKKMYEINRTDNTYVELGYATKTGVYSFKYYCNASNSTQSFGLKIG